MIWTPFKGQMEGPINGPDHGYLHSTGREIERDIFQACGDEMGTISGHRV